MKLNRSKLRLETLERRENPTATNIGFSTTPSGTDFTPVQFQVAGYAIDHNNADYSTTSSAFGIRDVAMTAPQAVTTANGGTVNTLLDDAFDGGLSWGLALANGQVQGVPDPNMGDDLPLTYMDLDGVVDIVGTPITSGVFGVDPLVYGPGAILTGTPESGNRDGSFNGLQLWQQTAVFQVDGAPVIRSVYFARNITGSAITQNLVVFSDLGSDQFTEIFASDNGDLAFNPGADTYVGSFQSYGNGGNLPGESTDPRLMFHVQGGFGDVRQVLDASSSFVNGDEIVRFNFNTTLAAGETKAFLVFTGLYSSQAAAIASTANFTNYAELENSGLLAGLSERVLSQIQNWDVGTIPPGEVIATLAGVGSQIRSFDADGTPVLDFAPFEGFIGGVSVGRGDVNGDGIDDIIVGAGPGAGPHVKVFDGATGAEIRSFFAFDGGFNGGLNVSSGDVNNDGYADIIVGTSGVASHVKVFDGLTGAEIRSFFAFEGFTGGVSVASGDVDGDGFDDIVVGTATGSSHVKVFSGATGAEIRSFFAFDGYTGGVSVAAGDFDGDGFDDIAVGSLQGVTHAKVFSAATGAEIASFFAYDGSLGGVSVAFVDADGDGDTDLATGSRIGSHVKAFGFGGELIDSFFSFADGFPGGIDVS